MNTDWIIRRIAKRNDRRRDPLGTYLWFMIGLWFILVSIGLSLQWMRWL